MDPLALIAVQNSIRSSSQYNAFDLMFQTLNPSDPNGNIERYLDVLKGNDVSLLHPYDILLWVAIFLSQLQIQVEQAFGLLIVKWHIFKKPLQVTFRCTILIIEAAFRLLNFCIDARESFIVTHGNCDPQTFRPTYMAYLDPLGDSITLKSKRHTVHQAILQKIKLDGRKRPCYNIFRNSSNTVGHA